MCAAGAHRGPDGERRASIPGGAFAHLALDVGRRPSFATGPARAGDQVLLVADARLDDRHRLLEELRREGQPLDDDAGDGELLLSAYLVWGEGCADRLRGDFALVVWDRRHRRVYCARDVFGVKPLHYLHSGERFCAASESQQIVLGLELDGRLDEVTVADYLLDQSWEEERTFFAEVRSLPPATYLVVERGRCRSERYWRPDRKPLPCLSGDELEEEVRLRLERSVAERVDSAGSTVGVAMSGGLDSCSVAAIGHGLLGAAGRRLQAYSYDFRWLPECDEGAYTSAMAAELGIAVEPVDTREHWLLGDEAAFEPDLEGPFQGWQSTDRQILEGLRRCGGRVLLTGLGGDNLFAGSSRVFLSQLLRGRASGLTGLLRHGRSQDLGISRSLYHFLLAPAWPRADRALRRLIARRAPDRLPSWIARPFAERTDLRRRLVHRPGARLFRDPARQAHWRLISCLESVGRAVYWLDRVASSYGVEVRHPYLDRDLAELVLAAPPEEHFRPAESKSLLRRVMAGSLPELVRRRPDKTRFGAFIDHSLRHKEPRRVAALFDAPLMADLGFVDPRVLRDSMEDYRRGRVAAPVPSLWYPITLELWLRRAWAQRRITEPVSDEVRIVQQRRDMHDENLVS